MSRKHKPAAKPAPRPAAKPAPRPAAKPAPLLDDPFDVTPTPDIPGVYLGIYKGIRNRCAIAYKRDDRNVWTVMFSENGGTRVLVKWGAADFDANMRHAPVPLNTHARRYPLDHAIDVFLKPGAVYEQAAYKVLTKLRKGQDPTEEDSLDELLDTTPSVAPMRARRTRTFNQKQERRAQRQAKLAAMTPAELRAFRDKRNARRRMRRANAKHQVVVTKKGSRK